MQVPALVAVALGVREQPGVPPAEVLARVLARQQLLLVLDNCEHVIDAATRLCATLLAACDDLRVLATSREPLRVAGEARYRLGPLALPGDPGVGSEAVTLFVDRARQVDTRFMLDDATGLAAARLVTRLDGMPLAIELAAARVEALRVVQLLDRLDDRFALLSAEDRRWPPGGTGRWRRPWSGATSCWTKTNSGFSARCRCSPGRSPWKPPGPSPGRARARRCCTWWIARCWSRRGKDPMAGPGTACWRRCVPTAPGCWPGPGSRTAPLPRWPGGRWK